MASPRGFAAALEEEQAVTSEARRAGETIRASASSSLSSLSSSLEDGAAASGALPAAILLLVVGAVALLLIAVRRCVRARVSSSRERDRGRRRAYASDAHDQKSTREVAGPIVAAALAETLGALALSMMRPGPREERGALQEMVSTLLREVEAAKGVCAEPPAAVMHAEADVVHEAQRMIEMEILKRRKSAGAPGRFGGENGGQQGLPLEDVHLLARECATAVRVFLRVLTARSIGTAGEPPSPSDSPERNTLSPANSSHAGAHPEPFRSGSPVRGLDSDAMTAPEESVPEASSSTLCAIPSSVDANRGACVPGSPLAVDHALRVRECAARERANRCVSNSKNCE